MSAGRILIGAAIAMCTGAVLGVLFAPDKGSVTRKKLSRSGTRYVGTVKKTASEYVDMVGETLDSARETAVGLTDKVKDAVEVLVGPDHQKTTRRA